MGYTHHWRIRDTAGWLKTWPQLVADAQRIIETTEVQLIHGGGEDTYYDPPFVDAKSGIYFNDADKQCETFILLPKATQFSFCKTRRKRYDEVVTAILLRAAVIASEAIEVSSDGDWVEWQAGRDLYLKIWPDDELICPWEEVPDSLTGWAEE